MDLFFDIFKYILFVFAGVALLGLLVALICIIVLGREKNDNGRNTQDKHEID